MKLLTPALALALAFVATTRPDAQYTPFHHDPKLLLEGNWQSCFDERIGQFDEKIYDQPQLDLEVHLGPGDEFAIFKGIQEEHRDHRSPDNLLQPFRVRGTRQRWELPQLVFEVVRAGGSRHDCRSFWITLEPVRKE
jgi:hypothetical protein